MFYDEKFGEIDKIFIDLDDVLVDFVGTVHETMTGSRIAGKKKYTEFFNAIESDGDDMWKYITRAGPDWWANLPKLPWADELWSVCNTLCDDVVILTSPGNSPHSAKAAHGKLKWAFKNFDENVVLLAYKKYMCASPGSLLIDDWDKFIKPWEERGGSVLKMRREWSDVGYTPKQILKMLKKHIKID